jgi:hypothetical protein
MSDLGANLLMATRLAVNSGKERSGRKGDMQLEDIGTVSRGRRFGQ